MLWIITNFNLIFLQDINFVCLLCLDLLMSHMIMLGNNHDLLLCNIVACFCFFCICCLVSAWCSICDLPKVRMLDFFAYHCYYYFVSVDGSLLSFQSISSYVIKKVVIVPERLAEFARVNPKKAKRLIKKIIFSKFLK